MSRTAPPASEKVQEYYDQNAKVLPTQIPSVKQAQIAVVGDSYTGGSSEGGTELANWTTVATGILRQDKVNVTMKPLGVGGSGYVKTGQTNQSFGQLAPAVMTTETTLIIYYGSRNDMSQGVDAVQSAAAKTFAESKTVAPQAKLLVIGAPWVDQSVPSSISAINAALEQAATQNGGVFVDPVDERWFFDNPELIGKDKTHPTDAGHAYMAGKIVPHIEKVIGSPQS